MSMETVRTNKRGFEIDPKSGVVMASDDEYQDYLASKKKKKIETSLADRVTILENKVHNLEQRIVELLKCQNP